MSFETSEQSALNEVGTLLQDLKENNPTAFEAYKSQIKNLVHTVSEAAGIGPGIQRIQSSFQAPQRAYSELLFNQLEKALGPLTNDLRYFLTTTTMEIEDFLLDNIIGAGIGGIIGGLIGLYFGHPTLGAMGGAAVGAGVQAAVTSNPPGARAWGLIPYTYDPVLEGNEGGISRAHDRDVPPLVSNALDQSAFDQLRSGNQLSSVTRTQIIKYRLHNIRM